MGTIIGMIVIYILFGKKLSNSAKAKGYLPVGFIILMYFFYFGIMLLSAYLLSLILDVDNDIIGTSVGYGSIILGVASAYFIPNLILNSIPIRKTDNKLD